MISFHGTVLITGASAGIGAACARAFSAAGARLILVARREERLHALADELRSQHDSESLVVGLDVRDGAAVDAAIAELPDGWAPIDVLVNNAGLGRGLDPVHEGSPEDWDAMIDTNVKALLRLTRAVVPGMVERGRGHVVNLGSTAGHEVYPGGAVYCATKHAVRAITRGLRMDLLGTPIRVTSVDPGLVETEFSKVRFGGDEARAARVYEGLQPLTAEDIADVVFFAATRPPHVNLDTIVMMPTAQASALLVDRE